MCLILEGAARSSASRDIQLKCSLLEKCITNTTLPVLCPGSYELPAVYQNFDEVGIPFTTLTNYSELLEVATEEDYITAEQQLTLKEWRKNPSGWRK